MRWLLLSAALWCVALPADELPLPVRSALSLRNVPADAASVHVVDVDSGEVLLAWHADTARNPASTMKLVTTLAALDKLGPAYQWQTEVYARGEIRDGVLDGDLLLKGYGDPFLVTERIWQLQREIRRAGVFHVKGDLLIDSGWFDVAPHDPAAFDKQPLRAYNVAPSAMLMNFKAVRYWFKPDGKGRVAVTLDPPLANLRVDNRLRTTVGPCRGFQRGIAVSMNDALDTVTFSGRFPSGCRRYALDRTALSHEQFVYGAFAGLWRESGGTLEGKWGTATVEDDEDPLLTFRSLPLHDVISRINKHSNNVMARQLIYTLAAEETGAPGTAAAGMAVIRNWLQENGLDGCCLSVQNGAGLSRDVRATAAALGALLQFAWRQPYMPEFLSSMSLSGLDGTLRRKFEYAGLTGIAHLKSGSMDHVSSLAGYLQARSGRRFAVVSIVNHTDAHRGSGDEMHEALLRWIVEQ